MVLPLLASVASAVGGVLAGPVGAEPPTTSGVQVSISPQADRDVLVLSVRVAEPTPTFAVLWPMAGIDPDSVEEIEPSWFARLEEFTRPRVEELRCDELVEVVHWATPPGCGSRDYVPPPPARGEDAADDLPIGGAWSTVRLFAEVVQPADLDAWLADRGLELARDLRERLAPHLEAGEPVLAIRPQTPVAQDVWLPPVRFAVPPGPVSLPLTLGVDLAETRQELVVYGVADAEVGNPAIENFPRGYAQDDCVLPADASAEQWYGAELDDVDLGADLPTWVLEYAGSAATCAPCVAEPLEAFEVRDFGLESEPEDARVSRVSMRWGRARLDEDPVVTFAGAPDDVALRWYEHDPRLGFAYPTCGDEDPEASSESCPTLRPPDEPRGCETGPARAGLALVALALLAGRRRRGAAGLALFLLLAAPARAAERADDLSPRTEVHLGLAVLGTDRVVPEPFERGAPWALNPYLAVEGRRSLAAFGHGTNLGVIGQLRGWTGDAAPGAAGLVGFTLLEPALGVDLRHGRFREGSPCWFGRYGASLALPTLLHRVTPSETAAGVLLHGGVGAWIGRGLRRGSIELRGSVLPRTDGYETVFEPEVAVPGWMFFPGTANLWIVAGLALW